jgi:ankyrin repeat protein
MIKNHLSVDLECHATVPVTPESPWLSDQQQQAHSAPSSAPPGFHWKDKNASETADKTTDIWDGALFNLPGETNGFTLFPEVNLQSLANSLGYSRLFDFDNASETNKAGGSASPDQSGDKIFQKLQGELLSYSEESARLKEAQQQQWRKEMKNNAEMTPLHLACSHNDPCLKTIRMLAETWPEFLERTDADGRTPLHVACDHGAPLEAVQFLVDKFSSAVMTADKFGNTPLHLACEKKGSYEVIQCLAATFSESSK